MPPKVAEEHTTLSSPETESAAPAPAQAEKRARTDAPQAEVAQAAQAAQAAPSGEPQVAQTVASDDFSVVLGAFVDKLMKTFKVANTNGVAISPDVVTNADQNFEIEMIFSENTLNIVMTALSNAAKQAVTAAKVKADAPNTAPAAAVESDAAAVQATTTTSPAPAVENAVNPTAPPALTSNAAPAAAEVQAAVETEADKAAADKAAADKAAADKAAADKAAADKAAAGGYRRRKRNLRTIKKQQQRNRKTMNKH